MRACYAVTCAADIQMEHVILPAVAYRGTADPYRELFERSPWPTWVYHRETLAFLAVNDAAIAEYGYSRQEFLAMTIRDIRPPEELPRLIGNIANSTSRFQHSGPWKHQRKDGTVIDVEISSTELVFGHQPARLVMVEDVTERERAHRLEGAVYRIAQAADTAPTLDDLYHSIHTIIAGVMPASNFYIALFDPEDNLVRFPYFVDELDEPFPPHPPAKGMTEYVLRTGKSLLCDRELEAQLREQGEIDLIGAPSPIWLGVPLRIDQKTIGVMALQHYTDPNAYGEPEQNMLEFVSSQVARVIERKRIEEQTQRRADELAALHENTRDLAAQQDLPKLLQTIVERASQLLRVSGGFVYLYDPARGDLEVVISVGLEHIIGKRLQKGEGLAGRVAQTLQPMVVDEYHRWDGRSDKYEEVTVDAVAEVPMLSGGELIGVLGVHEFEATGRRFSEADTRLLSLFAGQAASAVHNARLFAETCARAEQLGLLYDAGLALNGVLEPRAQLRFLFKIAVKTLHADRVEFFRYNRTQDKLCYELGTSPAGELEAEPGIAEFPVGQARGLVGWVAQQRLPLYLSDVAQDSRWIPSDPSIRSALWVPIEREKELLGVLCVHSRHTNAFVPQDERLLLLFANQAAVALENARLFAETARRLQRLHALADIDNAINNSLDLRVTLEVVLDQVITQLRADAASVLLLSPHTQMLRYTAGRGFHSRALYTELRLGEGLAGRAALERASVHCADLSQEPGQSRSRAWSDERFITYLALPLLAKGQVKGVLELFHRTPFEPDQEWLNFAQSLAGQAAIAVDNSELLQNLQRSNTELTLAYDATIEGWARALELRDHDTEGHTARVAGLTCRLAQALGIGEAECVHIRRGALLHDIGKIAIPDHILFKPGPLDEQEWEIMRRHPVYAYDMLSPVQYLRPALDIPYCHHENWDGTGYPRALQGAHIPLAARIFAAIDKWDALLSERPYRRAWPEAQVVAYLRDQAGRQLDPEIVETFLGLDKAPI